MAIPLTLRNERLRSMRALNRFALLLSSQLLLILMFPVAGARGLPEEFLGTVAIGVFFAGLHLVTESSRLRLIGGLLFAPAAVTSLFAFSEHTGPHLIITQVTSILFVGFVSAVILWELLTTPRVTGETLFGAVVGYLFIGIVFGMLYMLVEHVAPGSLRFSADPARRLVSGDTMFFSFVTLTTLGYGDLIPIGDIRALVLLEGVIGAMYPPVLIGRLLASYHPLRRAEGQPAGSAEDRESPVGSPLRFDADSSPLAADMKRRDRESL